MRTLINVACNEVPVFKKGYENLLHSFATEEQAARRESKDAWSELRVQKKKAGKLELEVQLLTEDAEKATDLQKNCLPRRLR